MIWSLLVGAGALLGIHLLQVASSSGHPKPLPIELTAFYAGVETLLLVACLGLLLRRSWVAAMLTTILTAAVLTSVLSLRSRTWASDFIPIALFLEMIWLGPWLLVAGCMWSRPS